MDILILGDFHGCFEAAATAYTDVCRMHGIPDLLIQVGDYGYFPDSFPSSPWSLKLRHAAYFIDGNHDDHIALRSLQKGELVHGSWEYMPRGTIRGGILYIGGARSVDARHRTRGLDWWPEENISQKEQDAILNAINAYQADTVNEPIHTIITHDAPGGVDVSEACVYTGKEIIDGNRKFLQHILDMVGPKRWFFGHYHKHMEGVYRGCEWRCIDMVRKDALDYVYFSV